jgi:hypothetical protein
MDANPAINKKRPAGESSPMIAAQMIMEIPPMMHYITGQISGFMNFHITANLIDDPEL